MNYTADDERCLIQLVRLDAIRYLLMWIKDVRPLYHAVNFQAIKLMNKFVCHGNELNSQSPLFGLYCMFLMPTVLAYFLS